ncbi:hypothetical protein ERJ75_000174400 [Trypanosoma vivax]|nr:hypothetical protein ERJ75_000174400 [Trypanosoma vivax]
MPRHQCHRPRAFACHSSPPPNASAALPCLSVRAPGEACRPSLATVPRNFLTFLARCCARGVGQCQQERKCTRCRPPWRSWTQLPISGASVSVASALCAPGAPPHECGNATLTTEGGASCRTDDTEPQHAALGQGLEAATRGSEGSRAQTSMQLATTAQTARAPKQPDMIGPDTAEEVRDDADARCVDLARDRGKSVPCKLSKQAPRKCASEVRFARASGLGETHRAQHTTPRSRQKQASHKAVQRGRPGCPCGCQLRVAPPLVRTAEEQISRASEAKRRVPRDDRRGRRRSRSNGCRHSSKHATWNDVAGGTGSREDRL